MEHDRKGTQFGAVAYGNGTVSRISIQSRLVSYCPKQVGFQIALFYDGPTPPQGLYDDLLYLPNSGELIVQGDFMKYVSSIVVPVQEQ